MDKPQTVKIASLHMNETIISFAHAQPREAAALLCVIQAAYAEFLGKLDPPSETFAETESSIGAKVHKGGAIKASADGELIGCVLYEPKGDFMYFGRLAVLSAWRRGGWRRG